LNKYSAIFYRTLGGNENVPGFLQKFPILALRSFLAKEMLK